MKYKLPKPKSRLSGVRAVTYPLVFFRCFLGSRYYNDCNIKKRAGEKQGERSFQHFPRNSIIILHSKYLL